jgi:hypothetical protein
MNIKTRIKKLEALLDRRKPQPDSIIIHFLDDPPLPKNPAGTKVGPLGPDQIIINFHRKRDKFEENK